MLEIYLWYKLYFLETLNVDDFTMCFGKHDYRNVEKCKGYNRM